MVFRTSQIFFLTVLLAGCLTNSLSLENASVSYKQNKDYLSLKNIHKSFAKGMQRKKVESLLGEADYSPIDGQYYYSSDRYEYSEDQERDVSIGLVIDYRDIDGEITEKLQEYRLGPIGE